MANNSMTKLFKVFYSLALILLRLEGIAVTTGHATWDRQSVEVNETQDLSLTCRISELGHLDVVRVVHINNNKQSTTITDNSNVKLPFLKLQRYKIHYDFDGTTGIVHLHYRGIHGCDGGTIICYKLSDDNTMASVHVKVYVPVNEVFITSISSTKEETHVGDNEEITLQDGGIVGVGCTASVNGSLTGPELQLMIGDEDKTEDSTATKKVTPLSSDNDLMMFSTEEKLTLIFDKVDDAYSRKVLKCTAFIKGYEGKTVTAVLRVRYAPTIACRETTYYAPIGGNVTFSCKVRSHPNANLNWQITSDNKLDNSIVTEKVLDEESVQVNLSISNLMSSHFTVYSLTATNAVGTSLETIILEEEIQLDFIKKIENNDKEILSTFEGDRMTADHYINESDNQNKFPEPNQSYSVIENFATVIRSAPVVVLSLLFITRWLELLICFGL